MVSSDEQTSRSDPGAVLDDVSVSRGLQRHWSTSVAPSAFLSWPLACSRAALHHWVPLSPRAAAVPPALGCGPSRTPRPRCRFSRTSSSRPCFGLTVGLAFCPPRCFRCHRVHPGEMGAALGHRAARPRGCSALKDVGRDMSSVRTIPDILRSPAASQAPRKSQHEIRDQKQPLYLRPSLCLVKLQEPPARISLRLWGRSRKHRKTAWHRSVSVGSDILPQSWPLVPASTSSQPSGRGLPCVSDLRVLAVTLSCALTWSCPDIVSCLPLGIKAVSELRAQQDCYQMPDWAWKSNGEDRGHRQASPATLSFSTSAASCTHLLPIITGAAIDLQRTSPTYTFKCWFCWLHHFIVPVNPPDTILQVSWRPSAVLLAPLAPPRGSPLSPGVLLKP